MLLESLKLDGETFATPPSITNVKGADVLKIAAERHLEGVVIKRRSAPYSPGLRNGDWIKVKNVHDQEVVIGGWTSGKGEREGSLGALLLGIPSGGGLTYVGKVGTGFSADDRKELTRSTRRRSRAKRHLLRRRSATLRPRSPTSFVPCSSARFATPSGRATACCANRRGGDCASTRARTRSSVSPERVQTDVDGRELSLSNLDKVLYPKTGFTKSQVLDYYARIADVMLPHINNRPTTLRRYPNGVDGMSFYEKHAPAHQPDWITTVDVPSKNDAHEPIEYTVVADRPTLLWAANLAALEFHVPLWHVAKGKPIPAPPDYMVFDLDPGPGTSIVECCRVARWVGERLGRDSLFPKTSGSKGLAALHASPAPDLGAPQRTGPTRSPYRWSETTPTTWSRPCERAFATARF